MGKRRDKGYSRVGTSPGRRGRRSSKEEMGEWKHPEFILHHELLPPLALKFLFHLS